MATRRSRRPGFEVLAAELKKGTLHPAYLLWGEESFLLTRALQQIVETVFDGATDDSFNLSRFSAQERGLGPALATAQELPMLRDRRVVIVEGVTGRDGYGFPKLYIRKPERDRLRSYLENPSPSTVLVLTGEVADYKQKSILELPNLKIFEMGAPSLDRLMRWVPRKAAAAGVEIEPAAVAELIEEVGSSMRQLESEIEKLALYCAEGETATSATVRALASGSTTESVFAVSDAIGRGEPAAAIATVRRLVELHVDGEVRVLSELRRSLTLWLRIRSRLDRGDGPSEIASSLGSPAFIVRLNLGHARRFSRDTLMRGLRRLLEIEHGLKTGTGRVATPLELLILELCGTEKVPGGGGGGRPTAGSR